MSDQLKIWKKIKDDLKKDLSTQNYKTWIEPLNNVEINKNIIKIKVENKFIKEWLEKNYIDKIKKIAIKNYKIEDIKIYIDTSKKNNNTIKKLSKEIKSNNNITTNIINKEYTFNNFISGSSNQFAAAAAMAVANSPATIYNPLFIYGGVGLGKTHLINAIGNEIIKNNNLKVCYYTSEKFTNELINAIRFAKMDEFRNKFRSIDVLLIDDVQFIAGKERTQEEFFHTFNSLYESHKQIVITSDKFPKEIPGLEERLRSRFEWGLIADIHAPDMETKQAILEAKAEQNNIDLPKDVAIFLASSVITNIRELEGYLVRIGAYSSLTSTPVTIDMAKDVLKDIIIESSKELTIEDIQKKVSKFFDIKVTDLKSNKRIKTFVIPRQIAMYLCRKLTTSSYPEIGEHFGGKDHSTVIHAIKKIEEKIQTDSDLKIKIKKIKNTLLPT